jgi:hypothetical protein
MSVLPLKADIRRRDLDVSFGPKETFARPFDQLISVAGQGNENQLPAVMATRSDR